MNMTSNRAYLLRAIYEWIVDNNCTPHLVVFADAPGVEVPRQHVNKDGQITLNISPSAVKDLFIINEAVSFNARFSGVVNNIMVPSGAVLGIYARENGQGMMFEFEGGTVPPEPTAPEPSPTKTDTPKRPSLTVVK